VLGLSKSFPKLLSDLIVLADQTPCLNTAFPAGAMRISADLVNILPASHQLRDETLL
jgi:hypothetical protein